MMLLPLNTPKLCLSPTIQGITPLTCGTDTTPEMLIPFPGEFTMPPPGLRVNVPAL